MIICKFSHNSSFVVDGQNWQIVGRDSLWGSISEKGWLHCHIHDVVNLREAVCHVYLVDGQVLEINGESGGVFLHIIRP